MVSAYDAYLNVKYPVTVESELNPLAKEVLSRFGFAELFGLKFAGTILALGILIVLYKINPKVGFICEIPLTIFQCFLLCFFWSI